MQTISSRTAVALGPSLAVLPRAVERALSLAA
jgi:hypothetical protein